MERGDLHNVVCSIIVNSCLCSVLGRAKGAANPEGNGGRLIASTLGGEKFASDFVSDTSSRNPNDLAFAAPKYVRTLIGLC